METFWFFSATVSGMQTKIEALTTTNALMKEDLSICRKELAKTQEENRKLLSQADRSSEGSSMKVLFIIRPSAKRELQW